MAALMGFPETLYHNLSPIPEDIDLKMSEP